MTNPAPQASVPKQLDPLLQIFLAANILDAQTMQKINLLCQNENFSLLNFLTQQQKISSQKIAVTIADYLTLDYHDLSQTSVQNLPKNIIDDQFIQQHQVLALAVNNQQLLLAITEPKQLQLLNQIKFHTDLNIQPVVVEANKLQRLLADYLQQQRYQPFNHTSSNLLLSQPDDSQIIKLVQQILLDAIDKGASDIHFEPYKTAYRIRIRVDGLLHKITQLSLELANRMTARLKVMSRLDISERRLPQDGRFTIEINPQQTRDCRISCCPTLHGEKIVVRILATNKTNLDIDDLGLESEQKTLFINTLKKPQGMLLVTGPTGSGKTISLYTALNRLNTLEKNISTVEDPVELELPGINQINVNPKIDLTFSNALRCLLRQDPDVIMIGEIRDKETADIALKSAQTGHLVLATLHTNSAIESLSRLLMMGIPAFNIVHSLQLIVAQRLLRKLCPHCKQQQADHHPALKILGLNHASIFSAVGCDYCMNGYSGRIGVFEALPITPTIANMFIDNQPLATIAQTSEASGVLSLRNAALNKVIAGETSLDEIQRVIL